MEHQRILYLLIIMIMMISQLVTSSPVEDGIMVANFFQNFGIDEGYTHCDNNIVYCDQDGYTIRM